MGLTVIYAWFSSSNELVVATFADSFFGSLDLASCFCFHQSGAWCSIPPPLAKHLSSVCPFNLQLLHLGTDFFPWAAANAA
jgi:hypothetical protein